MEGIFDRNDGIIIFPFQAGTDVTDRYGREAGMLYSPVVLKLNHSTKCSIIGICGFPFRLCRRNPEAGFPVRMWACKSVDNWLLSLENPLAILLAVEQILHKKIIPEMQREMAGKSPLAS